MTTIGFFNNKGGVDKTTLVYHVAWMLSELGHQVVVADLDPQANLTSMFVDEDRLEAMWSASTRPTVHSAMAPLFRRTGDIMAPFVEAVGERIGLLVGDLELSNFEDELGISWHQCMNPNEGAFRVISGFSRLIARAREQRGAAIALVDAGPNLGALNRAALLACDHVVVPVGADLFSLQGLRNMGPTLANWRREWRQRVPNNPAADIVLPSGGMAPAGYVVMRHSVRLDRPVRAYAKWLSRMPAQYSEWVLCNAAASGLPSIDTDPNCLATLKDFRSLMPMAQETRKPMFLLRPADGAFGGHQQAVAECRSDFQALTERIIGRCGIDLSLAQMLS